MIIFEKGYVKYRDKTYHVLWEHKDGAQELISYDAWYIFKHLEMLEYLKIDYILIEKKYIAKKKPIWNKKNLILEKE